MTLESALYFITNHSETIIQWLFLSILLLSAVLIARMLLTKKEMVSAGAGAGSGVASAEIQGFLQKILDQTAKLETVSLEKMNPAGMAQVEAQVQTLKKDLLAREDELTKLKASGDGKPSADADKLSGRIKELEAKLAEYEILEDDIADLSLYKEENARLKGELDRAAKGGAAPSVTETEVESSAAAALAADPIPPGEDIVAEFAEAVSRESTAEGGGEMVDLKPTGNPMDDFETAMKLEKKLHGDPPPAVAPASAPAAPPVAPPAQVTPLPTPPAAAAVTEGDDLFAEFAQGAAPEPAAAPEGGLDTDKMMEEMAALVSIEPTKGTALDDHIDTEKMALEATGFTKS